MFTVLDWKFIIFLYCVVQHTYAYILKDLNYSPDYIDTYLDQKPNLRQKILDKRKQKKETAERVDILDTYLSNDSVYLDGIMHAKVDENLTHLSRIQRIETAFKNLISLNGVKFIFKRDHYWRTWRKVKYPEGDKIVCYKCQRSENCKDCHYGGYWIIDENPPCPFEIVSVINSAEVCAINITNSTKMEKSCPSVVFFNDILSSCDNPIETLWRLQKDYKENVSERNLDMFCAGREFCEISTYYLITPNHVIFRIINSTNHIIYSKIMKENNTAYACVTDCGMIDPVTKTISKTDQPLVVDLINSKNKREDKMNDDAMQFNENSTHSIHRGDLKIKSSSKKLKQAINEMEKTFNLPVEYNKRKNNNPNQNYNDDENHNFHDRDGENHNLLDKDGENLNLADNYGENPNLSVKDSENHNLSVNRTYQHHHHHDKKNPTCSSMKHLIEEDFSDDIETYYNIS